MSFKSKKHFLGRKWLRPFSKKKGINGTASAVNAGHPVKTYRVFRLFGGFLSSQLAGKTFCVVLGVFVKFWSEVCKRCFFGRNPFLHVWLLSVFLLFGAVTVFGFCQFCFSTDFRNVIVVTNRTPREIIRNEAMYAGKRL